MGFGEQLFGYCLQFDTTKTHHVNHGFFWPKPPSEGGPADLGMFWWEFICCPQDSGSKYMLSDGYGGAHAALLGFTQTGPGSLNMPSGNFNGTPGTSFSLSGTNFGLMNGEWGNVCYAYDGANVYVYINGIVYLVAPYSGTRFSATEILGGGRRLYIGGSTHSMFNGKLQQYRAAEGGSFPLVTPLNGYVVERSLRAQFYDSSGPTVRELNLLCDLTQPARIVADLSSGAPAGYQGLSHPGSLHCVGSTGGVNDGVPASAGAPDGPLPQFVLDPTSPLYLPSAGPQRGNFYPPLTPPGGVAAYDSFGSPESSSFYDVQPSLGVTEVGGFTWQGKNFLNGGPAPGCRRAYQASSPNGPAGVLYFVKDPSLPSTNFDARVEFPQNPLTGPTNGPPVCGLGFRISDWNSLLFAQVLPDGAIEMRGGIAWFGAVYSPAFPQPYTKIRVTGAGNVLTLFVDDTHGGWIQVTQVTDATNAGVPGYGIVDALNQSSGAAPNNLWRAQNFSVR